MTPLKLDAKLPFVVICPETCTSDNAFKVSAIEIVSTFNFGYAKRNAGSPNSIKFLLFDEVPLCCLVILKDLLI